MEFILFLFNYIFFSVFNIDTFLWILDALTLQVVDSVILMLLEADALNA